MIVVCIGDGLGNQMFQYAFFLALKKVYKNTTVCVDICNFYGSYNEHNGYELKKVFELEPRTCSKRMAVSLADFHQNNFKKHPFLNTVYGIRMAICGRKQSYIIQDDATSYYDEVFHLNPLYSYMLRGNWINEHYFRDVYDEVVQSFQFQALKDEKNIEILRKIENSNSVSIHVRRGDFLKHNYCVNESYYSNAVSYIKNKLNNNYQLFVFSDDIEYCHQIFANEQNVVYINNNHGDKSYIDMQLMSKCKHNIISNSTFSFWGAFLNQNLNKIVVAPKQGMGELKNPFACEGWILL